MLVVAGLIFLAVTQSAGAAGWLPGTQLSTPSAVPPSGGDLAMDRYGNAVAVWVRNDGSSASCCDIVQGATKLAGRAWGPVTNLSVAGRNAASPAVAVDGRGHGVVAWVQSGGASDVIRYATVMAGRFGAAANMSVAESGRDAKAPQVVMNDTGAAVVVWARTTGTGTLQAIQAAARDSALGSFSLPEQISETEGSDDSPRAAINDAGQAVAVWVNTTGTGTYVVSAGRPAGGPDWLAPAPVGTSRRAESPDVALRPDGSAVAVYIERGFRLVDYEIGRYTGFGMWPEDQIVDPAGGPYGHLRAAAVDARTDIAVWQTHVVNGEQLMTATRTGDGAFGAAKPLSATVPGISDVRLAGTPGVNTLATWSSASSSYWGAIVRPNGGGWGDVIATPVTGTLLGTRFSMPADVDDQGSVLVMFMRLEIAGYTLYASAADTGPPSLSGVTVPRQVWAGSAAAMSALSTDRWSGSRLTWSFGDGAAASGPTPTHVYLVPGVYRVTVTARDGAGNAASETRAIQVVTRPRPDKDGDGFNDLQDCNDSNPDIHPGAVEIPGNRIDENCDKIIAPLPFVVASMVYKTQPSADGQTVELTRLRITAPAKSRITARCRGRGCPTGRIVVKVRRKPVSMRRLLHRPLGRGARIDLAVTASGFRGIGWRLRVVGRRQVDIAMQRLCVRKPPDRLGRCPR